MSLEHCLAYVLQADLSSSSILGASPSDAAPNRTTSLANVNSDQTCMGSKHAEASYHLISNHSDDVTSCGRAAGNHREVLWKVVDDLLGHLVLQLVARLLLRRFQLLLLRLGQLWLLLYSQTLSSPPIFYVQVRARYETHISLIERDCGSGACGLQLLCVLKFIQQSLWDNSDNYHTSPVPVIACSLTFLPHCHASCQQSKRLKWLVCKDFKISARFQIVSAAGSALCLKCVGETWLIAAKSQ